MVRLGTQATMGSQSQSEVHCFTLPTHVHLASLRYTEAPSGATCDILPDFAAKMFMAPMFLFLFFLFFL